MFTTLFTYPSVQARHLKAPYAESREQFLVHCAEQGYLPSSLQKIACVLLALSKNVVLCNSKQVTLQQIETAADHRGHLIQRKKQVGLASSRQMFIQVATAWFRFRRRMVEPQPSQSLSSVYIEDFARFMRDERGLSPVTITNRCQQIRNYLEANLKPGISLNAISIKNVDTYLAHQGNKGWSRGSLHILASTLRNFFRYAEGRGWSSGITESIEAPRLFAEEGLPLGLTWEEVEELVASTAGDCAADVRNHAIILLLVVYGLRRGEVARLRLEDVDWEGEVLRVARPKQRCTQHYPLVPSVGNAILRYLMEIRPKCIHRELFLSLNAPIRPLLPCSISPVVNSRLAALGVTRPRLGAHCLRHACAQRLLAAGFSLKQIGDQLGHRSASVTLHYVKIDLNGLRQVAELDLGGVV